MSLTKILAAAVLAVSAVQANAATVSKVVMKVSDSRAHTGTVIDPYLDWTGLGGINEGVAGATSLTNNGIDYKDSWVDTNWGDVLSVRVSMYNQGGEVAFAEFSPGTSRTDFFAAGNVTGSSMAGFAAGPHNYFSIAGGTADRHWFVNRNYGGCGNDTGWMAVLDGSGQVCGWSTASSAAIGSVTRGFIYTTAAGPTNWNNTPTVGIADVFAVSVNYDDGMAPIPVPASGLMLVAGLAGLASLRRRKHKLR